ncbi:MAG: hypothetical protein ABIO70_27865 [Pseudomonadota bacterium]
MILPLIALLAGCGGQATAPVVPTTERNFQVVYLANLSGEIEPCG